MMNKLRPITFADLYREFFQVLLLDRRRKGKVRGPVRYTFLTRAWLRTNVMFIYGENGSKFVPYFGKELPRKSFMRESRNKILGCVILYQWLKREQNSKLFLLNIFSKNGVNLSYISSEFDSNSVDQK